MKSFKPVIMGLSCCFSLFLVIWCIMGLVWQGLQREPALQGHLHHDVAHRQRLRHHLPDLQLQRPVLAAQPEEPRRLLKGWLSCLAWLRGGGGRPRRSVCFRDIFFLIGGKSRVAPTRTRGRESAQAM